MLPEYDNFNGHERFRELSALANAGELTASEWTELKEHLRGCEDCRDVHNEYRVLDRDGMRMLAADRSGNDEQADWDDKATRAKLFARVREAERVGRSAALNDSTKVSVHILSQATVGRALWATAAVVVIVGVAFGAYRLRTHRADGRAQQVHLAAQDQVIQTLVAQKRAISDELEAKAKRLSQLETDAPQREQELAKLRSGLQIQDSRLNDLMASKSSTEAELRAALQQRDSLSARLETTEQNYEAVHSELVGLRAERDKAMLRLASLESDNNALLVANRDQEHRLKNAEQYLSSDRDIRELMGARNLYIADVYDVDSRSRTQKPFGRVFYTRGKSLIFYAFDLERPGVKNASAKAYQVWAKRSSDDTQPFNLGVLYQDSVANRRWVLRFDDPRQLAEINTVFVTVEPNGGSLKPTGKPFLYSLLRNEVNHP